MTSEHQPGRRTHQGSLPPRGHRRSADPFFDDVDENGLYLDVARRSGPGGSLSGRVALLAAATILLVPVIAALRGGDEPTEATPAQAVAVIPAVAVGDAATTTAVAPVAPADADTSGSSSSGGSSGSNGSNTSTGSKKRSTTTQTPATTADPTTDAPTTSGDVARRGPVATIASTTTTQPTCVVTYEAAAGDFWIGIADRAGVDLRDLLVANGATAATALFPGDDVCIPAGGSDPGPPATTPTTVAPTTAPPTTKAPTTTTKPPTTTQAPSTTQPPSTQPPTSYTREQVIAIIRDVWPDELEERAIQIAQRESNFVPTAKNYCCYGLFQMYWNVHKGWMAGIGITSAEQLFNPRTNAIAAYTLYLRAGGWGPWAL